MRIFSIGPGVLALAAGDRVFGFAIEGTAAQLEPLEALMSFEDKGPNRAHH